MWVQYAVGVIKKSREAKIVFVARPVGVSRWSASSVECLSKVTHPYTDCLFPCAVISKMARVVLGAIVE